MLKIYSGNDLYLRSNYLHVYLRCYQLGTKSPKELVELAENLQKHAFCNPKKTLEYTSNSPDFVRAVSRIFELYGMEYKLYLNGVESDLETVMRFFNEAFDYEDSLINELKVNKEINEELLLKNGFSQDPEYTECLIKESDKYLLSFNKYNQHTYFENKENKLIRSEEVKNLYDFQLILNTLDIDIKMNLGYGKRNNKVLS